MSQPMEETISELLTSEGITTVVLKGESGSGKTWIARKFRARATKKGLFDYIFWFSLCRRYDKWAFYKRLANQLSMHSAAWENLGSYIEVDAEEEENLEVLERKIFSALQRRSCLLILDDEGEEMVGEEIMWLLPSDLDCSFKLLIASAKGDDGHDNTEATRVINVRRLSEEEALSLFEQRAGSKVFQLTAVRELAEALAEMSPCLPATIGMIGKVLNYSGRFESEVPTLKGSSNTTHFDANQFVLPLLCNSYEMLPNSILMDCAWRRTTNFFHHGRSIHHNELVTFWILEGYLGHMDSIERAYVEGRRILSYLIDCRLLKIVETDYVVLGSWTDGAEVIAEERAVLNLDHSHNIGPPGGIASLGLVEVFDGYNSGGLDRITLADGMLRTPYSSKSNEIFLTILVDGNHPSGEFLGYLYRSAHALQVLAIFNLKLQSLPPVVSNMSKLNMLVLRDCDSLGSVEDIELLSSLTVLEISGSSSLSYLPDSLFERITQLGTLNLSSLPIKYLPLSFYGLSELKWLILRDFPNLTSLKSFRKFSKLMMLNLSGCNSLEALADENLKIMPDLRTLDVSYTNLKGLPILNENTRLTHVLLRGSSLESLPKIGSLTSLKVLDVSESGNFIEFQNTSFETIGSLKILDLSGTIISQLPSPVSRSLQHIYLKGCSRLERLPPMEGLKDLKTLYLSGVHLLSQIEDKFFEYLENLQILDLSETNLKILPSPPNPCKLRKLFLSCCSSLEKLPNLRNFEKLEVLNLSGCNALREIPEKSFDQMICLKSLNLSETSVESLPSLSNVTNLRTLLLKSCTQLKVLPNLASMSKLEELNLCGVICFKEISYDFLEHMCDLRILDLSETLLSKLPSMSKLEKLEQLFLRDCMHLESSDELEDVKHLKVLDLSVAALQVLPSIGDSTYRHSLWLTDHATITASRHLENLGLPSTANQEEGESENLKNLIKCNWKILMLPEISVTNVNSSVFFQLLEKKPVLLVTDTNQFHFSVGPAAQQTGEGDSLCNRDELILRSTHFLDVCFSYFKARGRSLGISGFMNLPIQIDDLLHRAEYLFLFDSEFANELNDLGLNNIKLLKGCWVDSCRKLESVFRLNADEDVAESENWIEMLWLSNNLNLKIIWSGHLQHQGFQNLKYMHLYSCPKISSVFSSFQQAKNLEFLQITFCDELQSLFDSSEVDSGQRFLPKLKTMHLWELPKLECIGCMMPVLESLKVGECSRLKKVLSSSLPQENLAILQISGCDRLETVIERSASVAYKLPNLHSLHLSELPELKSFGGLLPSLQESFIMECSKLHLPLN